MGFMTRMYNLWTGFLSIFVGKMEEKHPEIAYENAINGMTEKYAKLKTAAAGLIKHRDKTRAKLEKAQAEVQDLRLQVQMAVDSGEDEVALVLLERQEELEGIIAESQADLADAAKQAETAKESLRSIKVEIDKLKRERDKTVATIKDAEARKQIQEQLDGLSVDDDIKALDNVREYAETVKAEANIGSELAEDGIDAKLKALKAKTGTAKARARLDALKAKRQGTSAGGGESEKNL